MPTRNDIQNELSQQEKRVIIELFAAHGHKPFSRYNGFRSYRQTTIDRAYNISKRLNIMSDDGSGSLTIFNKQYDNSVLNSVLIRKNILKEICYFPKDDVALDYKETVDTIVSSRSELDLRMKKAKSELRRLEEVQEVVGLIESVFTEKDIGILIDLANSMRTECREGL